MIFTISAFEETKASLECHGSPAVHPIGTAPGRQMRNGIINIFYHLGHHQLTRVARLVQIFILRTQLSIVPRHITEPSYLVKIEISTKETSHGCVMLHSFSICTTLDVLQQGVNVAQRSPTPTASRGWYLSSVAAHHDFVEDRGYQDVTLLIERRLV